MLPAEIARALRKNISSVVYLLDDQANKILHRCWLNWAVRDAMKKRACLLTIAERDNVRPFLLTEDVSCKVEKFA